RLNLSKLTAGLLKGLQIIEHEVFMAVSWRTERGAMEHLAYAELNLAGLLEQARSLRGQAFRRRAGDYEVLLRSLGQHLDAEEFELSGIVERDEEFIVLEAPAAATWISPMPNRRFECSTLSVESCAPRQRKKLTSRVRRSRRLDDPAGCCAPKPE